MKYKYLITGGAGFIGSEVANCLTDNCVVIDNLSTGKISNLSKNVKFEVGDIRDFKFLDQVFKKYKPQKVIHLAAQVSASKSVKDPTHDAEINILGSINILEMAAKYKCKKIVLASSAAVYGDNKNLPLKETEELAPLSPYGISKMTMETYAKLFYASYGLKYSILRFSNVYGAKQNSDAEGGAVAIFTENLLNNKDITIYGDGRQTRDFINVKDVAIAVIKVVENQTVGTYNVSTNKAISINDLVKIMKDIYKSSSGIKHAGNRQGDIKHSRLDNSKLVKEFNWKPLFSVDTGIADMKSQLIGKN